MKGGGERGSSSFSAFLQEKPPLCGILLAMIPYLRVVGGRPLHGSLSLSGAKNSINKLIVASMLSPTPAHFTHVPDIVEVDITLSLCAKVGMQYLWNRPAGTLSVVTPSLTTTHIPLSF
ncbi:MAG: hypothetical protein VXZ72_01780, partial [Chlamydiota bacterium]|nr:hypothetical protein [Chlamydiota bacterium]